MAAKDAQAYWEQATDALSFGVPGGAGFSLGLAYGVGGGLGRALAGWACQILPASSSTRILNFGLLSQMASYDIASDTCQIMFSNTL